MLITRDFALCQPRMCIPALPDAFPSLSPSQTLSGHTSAVESLLMDPTEELIVAGGGSGTLKLWDLMEAKGEVP